MSNIFTKANSTCSLRGILCLEDRTEKQATQAEDVSAELNEAAFRKCQECADGQGLHSYVVLVPKNSKNGQTQNGIPVARESR